MRERQVKLTGTGATLRLKATDRRTDRAQSGTEGREKPIGKDSGLAIPAEKDRRKAKAGSRNQVERTTEEGDPIPDKDWAAGRSGRHAETGAKARGSMQAPILMVRDQQRTEKPVPGTQGDLREKLVATASN